MLSRLPWTPRPEAKPPLRMSKERRRLLTDQLATIVRRAEPTPFAFEAMARHAIRSALCLAGTRWTPADLVAAAIVQAALDRIGAKRPNWEMGQPEWTQPGIIMVERTRCRHCGSRLPEGNKTYCSNLCMRGHARDRYDDDKRAELSEAARLRLIVWCAAQRERRCEECSLPFRPNARRQRFCCKTCANRVNASWRRHHAA